MSSYVDSTNWIVGHCGGADKFAHTYVGLALWIAVAVLCRRPLGSRLPVVVVMLAELGNEGIDRIAHGSWRWMDTLGDIVATLFWPTVLTVLMRNTLLGEWRARFAARAASE